MQELFLIQNLVLYQDLASGQDSRQDPGSGEIFLGRIPARTIFSAVFLPMCTVGIFLGRIPPGKLASLAESQYLFYKGGDFSIGFYTHPNAISIKNSHQHHAFK